MSEKMSTERAAKILDPKHRESYESLAIVEEACQMSMLYGRVERIVEL